MFYAIAELVPQNIQFDPNVFWGHFWQWAGTVATVIVVQYFLYLNSKKKQDTIINKLDDQNVKAAEDGKAVAAAAVNSEAVAKKVGVTSTDVAEATKTIAVKKEIVAAEAESHSSSWKIPKP